MEEYLTTAFKTTPNAANRDKSTRTDKHVQDKLLLSNRAEWIRMSDLPLINFTLSSFVEIPLKTGRPASFRTKIKYLVMTVSV